eukprot:15437921-Alexandrium_andersonii.AAC.1
MWRFGLSTPGLLAIGIVDLGVGPTPNDAVHLHRLILVLMDVMPDVRIECVDCARPRRLSFVRCVASCCAGRSSLRA